VSEQGRQGKTEGNGRSNKVHFSPGLVDPLPNTIMSSDRGLVTALPPPANRVSLAQFGRAIPASEPTGPQVIVSSASDPDPSEHSMLSSRFNWRVSLTIVYLTFNTPPNTHPMTYLVLRTTCAQRGEQVIVTSQPRLGPLTLPSDHDALGHRVPVTCPCPPALDADADALTCFPTMDPCPPPDVAL
jgi:hypothetical protein